MEKNTTNAIVRLNSLSVKRTSGNKETIHRASPKIIPFHIPIFEPNFLCIGINNTAERRTVININSLPFNSYIIIILAFSFIKSLLDCTLQ